MRTRQVVLGCVCLLAVAAVLVVTPVDGLSTIQESEDNPQAEAGLDQTVRQGAVVVLDAGGSVAPDGEIIAYNWTIRRPDNSTIAPDCRDCRQTQFQPTQVGTHAVTVTVTDDENRTATDTMYVEVLAHEPPQPSISTPDRVQSNETVTVEFTVAEGDEPLSSVARYRDGTLQYGEFVDGPYSETVTIDYPEPGTRKFELVAADEVGHAQTAVEMMDVKAVPPYFAVDIVNVTEIGGDLRVAASVENIGGLNDTQSIRLCREECSNEVIDEMATVSLAPGEATTVVGNWSDWDDENGEVFVAVESENDSAIERRILAEPSHLSIQGLPAEMEDGERTDVRVVLHYEGGITETVTDRATVDISQTEPHSYISITDQESYDPLTVEATSTQKSPDTSGKGVIEAEYEGLTDQNSTTILPECEVNPSNPDCPGGWNYGGNGQGEFAWKLQGAVVPDEINLNETIDPGFYFPNRDQYVRMSILIYDYVNLDLFNSSIWHEADPEEDYTSKAETRTYRVREPEHDSKLWAWEPNSWFQDPYRVDKVYRGGWGTDWDRWASMTGAEGSAYVYMQQGVINQIDPREAGNVNICLRMDPRVFDPRNQRGDTYCKSMDIVDNSDEGPGDPVD